MSIYIAIIYEITVIDQFHNIDVMISELAIL